MYNAGDFPNRITVELTNKCNIECEFCPRHIVDMNLGFMDKKLFHKIVDEAKAHLPVCMVFFFRGESLLHPNLIEFIKYAKEQGITPLQIASNALALSDKLADELIDSGLDFISFSLDTNNDEIYQKSRKYGNLKTSRENVINFCKKAAKRREQGLPAPEIQVSTVDIEEYRAEQQDFIDFWIKHADRVRVYVEHSSDNNPGSLSCKESMERKACKKVYTDLIVYWDGNTGICNHDWDNKLNLGNVNEQSVKNIWNSEKYGLIREMHEKCSFSPSQEGFSDLGKPQMNEEKVTSENRNINSLETYYNNDIVCKNCDHWQVYYMEEGLLGKVYERNKDK